MKNPIKLNNQDFNELPVHKRMIEHFTHSQEQGELLPSFNEDYDQFLKQQICSTEEAAAHIFLARVLLGKVADMDDFESALPEVALLLLKAEEALKLPEPMGSA